MAFNFSLFSVLRRRQKLTIRVLADRIGVQPSTISRWERGLTQPYKKQIKLIAKLFRKKQTAFQDPPISKGKRDGRKKNSNTSVASPKK
jgi:transcriptional regulator with XRE-family HTH domain